jgi:hypothetical protein
VKQLMLGITLMFCGSAAQAAEVFLDQWELGVRFGGAITDDSYSLDGSVETLSLLRTLGPKAAIELEVTADQLDFGIDYGLKHRSFALNYLSINREPLWDPYFLVGAGAIQFDSPEAIDKGTDAMVQAAVGGTWQLLESGKLLFRADLRVRYDLNDSRQPGQDGFGDAIVTFGLSIPLGDR